MALLLLGNVKPSFRPTAAIAIPFPPLLSFFPVPTSNVRTTGWIFLLFLLPSVTCQLAHREMSLLFSPSSIRVRL